MTKGQRISNSRKIAGLTQVELAKKVGISKQLLYKYEKGSITNIPSDKIEAIAEACGTTPEFLMGWNEEDGLEYEKQNMMKLAKEIVREEQLTVAHLKLIDFVKDLSEEQAKAYLDFFQNILNK